MRYQGSVLLLAVVAGTASPPGAAADDDLASLDLQQLMQMDVQVTTASKSAQSIYSVAAPITVITAEDIARAGARSIPEAIRLAPGVVVSEIDPGKWVVGIRGFAWQYANKALILLDGRAVYTPLNSAVYWNTLDVPMDEIDRIEVIRGPGDARWGSHAVNGIINIITRPAAEARGPAASALLDSNGGGEYTARYGGALSPTLDYRVYAKYLDQGDFASARNFGRIGDRTGMRAGVRLDGHTARGDRFSLIGDVQDGRDTSVLPGQGFLPLRYDANEWSIVGRWDRGDSTSFNQQLQVSFDRLEQRLYETRNTIDLSYQMRLPEWRAQTWTFGTTYKNSSDGVSDQIAIQPKDMSQDTYGVFIHDNVALGPATHLLLGSQLEHNRFTGWELQPNLQLIYSPAEHLSYWASVSRAVRTPMRAENGFNLEVEIFPGGFVLLQGNQDLRAERVVAYQAGMRVGVRDNLFVDVTAFYNNYHDLLIQTAGVPIIEPDRILFPAVYENSANAKTKGIEASVESQPFTRWKVAASASLYSQTRLVDPFGYGSVTGIDHQYQLHSTATVASDLEWNVDVYYVGEPTTHDIPSYWKVDSQLTWTRWKSLSVSLGVKNAFDHEHVEVGGNAVDTVTGVPRTAYLRLFSQ